MLDLTCPNFQIFIGASNISLHVTGYSFRHPLAEPSTPLIWTGQIELDLTVNTSLGSTFFDDEVNPSVWLSGLQPIDVYFNGVLWQRFRVKPSGYRYDQITGQAVVEITDIIGILDSYQPSADTPEFKTGGENRWNDLAVALIKKQASLMGTSVSVQTPSYGIGGIFKVPRSIGGSYIKEAQKMAGERGFWMWSDKEVIKWVEYPQVAQNVVWRKSRKELLTFTRQQGLDPVKQSITVTATHEDVDTCSQVFPQTIYTYGSIGIAANTSSGIGQRYKFLQSIEVRSKSIVRDCVYTLRKQVNGNPMLTLFGGTVDELGRLQGEPPEAKGYTVTKANVFGGFAFIYDYKKNGTAFSAAIFTWDWTRFRPILDEKDVTTYEDIPIDSQNPSKILSKVVTRSEPWAKFPDGLQYFENNEWFIVSADTSRRITERVTITYEYIEIKRDDIIVQIGQKLYEVKRITELKEVVYFKKEQVGAIQPYIQVTPILVPSEKTVTTYTKQCQGRWTEKREFYQNKGQSKTSTGYLYGGIISEQDVSSIPEITYRPAPYPVLQRPLLGTVRTGYAGVSPFVNSKGYETASTLTTKAECDRYASYLGRIKWQRYYGRELASGFGTVLNYAPFQGVQAGSGAYIRDRFGVSLNRDGDEWQFVEDCIGNKTGTIAEIQAPPLPYPPLLLSSLAIGIVPDQTVRQNQLVSINLLAAGGTTPYRFFLDSIPIGMYIYGNVLAGNPQDIGVRSLTLTVYDAEGNYKNTTFSFTVIAPDPLDPLPYFDPPIPSPASTLNIGASPALNFVQDVAIAPITFYSAGGQLPYAYSSSALPSGLSLSSGGVLSGTPTAIATTSVTVTVTDNLGATSATTFNIVVGALPIPISIVSEAIDIKLEIEMETFSGFLGGLPMPIASVSTFIDSMKVSFTPVNRLDILSPTQLDNLTPAELDNLLL